MVRSGAAWQSVCGAMLTVVPMAQADIFMCDGMAKSAECSSDLPDALSQGCWSQSLKAVLDCRTVSIPGADPGSCHAEQMLLHAVLWAWERTAKY